MLIRKRDPQGRVTTTEVPDPPADQAPLTRRLEDPDVAAKIERILDLDDDALDGLVEAAEDKAAERRVREGRERPGDRGRRG